MCQDLVSFNQLTTRWYSVCHMEPATPHGGSRAVWVVPSSKLFLKKKWSPVWYCLGFKLEVAHCGPCLALSVPPCCKEQSFSRPKSALKQTQPADVGTRLA
jgi:hypothetical protein